MNALINTINNCELFRQLQTAALVEGDEVLSRRKRHWVPPPKVLIENTDYSNELYVAKVSKIQSDPVQSSIHLLDICFGAPMWSNCATKERCC